MNTIEFYVSTHFLSAIINCDDSGLDLSDRVALERFYKQDLPKGHWSTDDDQPSFRRCDICHLLADTVLLEWVII